MTDSTHLEQEAAQRAWTNFLQGNSIDTRGHNMNAFLGPWTRTNSQAGPMLSARVLGPDAVEALALFAVAGTTTYAAQGARQIPHLDIGVPGRVACVWQSGGVWVELWHPDTTTATSPVQDAPLPKALGVLGGRLPFTRRRKAPAA
jgi:hypothetical protein